MELGRIRGFKNQYHLGERLNRTGNGAGERNRTPDRLITNQLALSRGAF